MTPLALAKRHYLVVMAELQTLCDRLDVPLTPDIADAVHDAVVAPHYDASQQASRSAVTALGLLPPDDVAPLLDLLDTLIEGDRTTTDEARRLDALRKAVA